MTMVAPLRAASLGYPGGGPRGIVRDAVIAAARGRGDHETVALRAAYARRGRLAAHAAPAIGLPPVLMPVNDASIAGRVADTALLLGALPADVDAVAPGVERELAMLAGGYAPAFDTPLVLHPYRAVAEAAEACRRGVRARAVLLGPVSFLVACGRLDRLDEVVGHYERLVQMLAARAVNGIQLDEPVLSEAFDPDVAAAITHVTSRLRRRLPRQVRLVLTASPDTLHRENVALAAHCPADVVHVDLVTDPGLLPAALAELRPWHRLSLGVVGARPGEPAVVGDDTLIDGALRALGAERVELSTSASLEDLPPDADDEPGYEGPCARSRLRVLSGLAVHVTAPGRTGARAARARPRGSENRPRR